MITRVRGTEDILNVRLYNFMLNTMKHHLSLYNFSEIDTPILEHTELFVRSVGSDTDVVSKEMYIFQTASGESLCLRPEITASIVRAFIDNRIEQSPWKVFTHGPVFRHERPQAGRWRQFTQTSIEILNSKDIEQDAQFLKMLDVLFYEIFKLENYVLKLNFLGCSDDRKAHRDTLVEFLSKNQSSICATCLVRKDKNPLRVFDCKNEACKSVYQNAPKITDHLCKPCTQEWKILQQLLAVLSVNYAHDTSLVRGLDYYNRTVFEFSSRDLGAQNAFCGGGRYSLGKEIGAKDDIHGLGVGIGMGRLLMLIEKNLTQLSIPQDKALHVIIPFTPEQIPLALLVAQQLLENGIATDVLLDKTSLSSLMKKANKLGSKFALLIGPDEQQAGTIAVKNMINGETKAVQQSDIVSCLRN